MKESQRAPTAPLGAISFAAQAALARPLFLGGQAKLLVK